MPQDREPSFQGGGVDKFRVWTALHTLYPPEEYEAGKRGSVRVSFNVETDGTLSGIKVIDSPKQGFSEAVIKSIEKSPAWEPAIENGKAVRREIETWIPFYFFATYNKLLQLPQHAPGERDSALVPPRFNGGDHNVFREWAALHINYPQAAEEKWIEGKAIVTFIILKDGSMGPLKVISFSHWSFAAEAVKIVQSSPRWEPATKDGIPVNYSYTLPFYFVVKEENYEENTLFVP